MTELEKVLQKLHLARETINAQQDTIRTLEHTLENEGYFTLTNILNIPNVQKLEFLKEHFEDITLESLEKCIRHT